MADFGKFVFTNKGRQLCAKTQIGTQLHFTRAACGDGWLPDRSDLRTLSSLISEKLPLAIDSMKITGDGMVTIRTVVSNKGITKGFFLREIGLFAADPDEGEILYAVANAGEYADFLTPESVSTVQEEIIDLITVIGDAENVTINLSDSNVYVNKEEFRTFADEVKCAYLIDVPILHNLGCYPKAVVFATAWGFGWHGYGDGDYGGESESIELKRRGIFQDRNSMKIAVERKYNGVPALRRVNESEFIISFGDAALNVSLMSDYATVYRMVQASYLQLNAQAGSLNMDINALLNSVNENRVGIASANGRINGLDAGLATLTSTVNSNRNEASQALANTHFELSNALLDNINENRIGIASANGRINGLDAGLTALINTVNSNRSEADQALASTHFELSEKISTVPKGYGN